MRILEENIKPRKSNSKWSKNMRVIKQADLFLIILA